MNKCSRLSRNALLYLYRKPKGKNIVVVFEFNARESFQITKILKEELEKDEQSENMSPNEELSLFEPIKNMVRKNLKVKIVVYFRTNFYDQLKVSEMILKNLKTNEITNQWEMARSSGDLWFMLRK